MTLKMRTPSLFMTSFSSSSTPSILHQNLKINSSDLPSAGLNSTTLPFKFSGLGMSCFTMILGAISNLTALGILVKSHVRFRRQSKAPFLLLTVALLLADLGGHVIPGAFAMYLHTAQYKMQTPTGELCKIFGACMVFFGLCPLLLGCAMAIERCVAITQPFFYAARITVAHAGGAVIFLSSLALILAVLPFSAVGTYTKQFPGTWCFLSIHAPQSKDDINLSLAFSCLGLIALTLSLLCNILSGLVLLQARIKAYNVNAKSAVRCSRHASSTSSSSLILSLDVEMMTQLAVITVVSCVCWSPFLIRILLIQFIQSPGERDEVTFLALRMASWNQILDPWVYILLRRAVLYRVYYAFHTQRPSVTAKSSCELRLLHKTSLQKPC